MFNNKNMNDHQPTGHRSHHIRGVLRKWKSYIIGVAIVSILALSVFAFSNVFAGSVADNGSYLASKYKIANALESKQVAVYGDTTVRLLYVIPSSSQTLVELEIEEPGIGNGETLLPLQTGINLNLRGFVSNDLLGPSQVKVGKGKQKVVLDLPPLSDFNAKATLELSDLKKLNHSTGKLTTVTGPWQLSFTPKVQTEQLISRDHTVGKKVEAGDLRVHLQRVHISATETLVYYQMQDMKDIARAPLGQPTLEYAGKVLRANAKNNNNDDLVLSFPALPDDVNQFTVTFPGMMSLEGPGAQFSIPLGEYLNKPYTKGESIPMDQVIEINSVKFRFTGLVVSEDSFTLHCQPYDENQFSRVLLACPGDVSEVMEAKDDKGNHYTVVSAGALFDSNNFKLKEQDITFQGSFNPEASALNISISATGVIGDTFVFKVEVTK